MDVEGDRGWLSAMPALTELQVSFGGYVYQRLWAAIGRCGRLQSLCIKAPIFKRSRFQMQATQLMSAAGFQRLRHFVIADFKPQPDCLSLSDLAEAVLALPLLQSLRLSRVCGIDALLAELPRAAGLRELTVDVDKQDPDYVQLRGAWQPSASVLAGLLMAAPRLVVRLGAPASMDPRSRHVSQLGRKSVDPNRRPAHVAQWRRLHRMAVKMQRVTLQLVDV